MNIRLGFDKKRRRAQQEAMEKVNVPVREELSETGQIFKELFDAGVTCGVLTPGWKVTLGGPMNLQKEGVSWASFRERAITLCAGVTTKVVNTYQKTAATALIGAIATTTVGAIITVSFTVAEGNRVAIPFELDWGTAMTGYLIPTSYGATHELELVSQEVSAAFLNFEDSGGQGVLKGSVLTDFTIADDIPAMRADEGYLTVENICIRDLISPVSHSGI